MPEGDSVYRLRARLAPATTGKTIVAGELRSGPAAGTSVAGARLIDYGTHGKHLMMRFDTGKTLHTHLRMQGSWTITGAGRTLPRRELHRVRVRMLFDDSTTLWGIDVPVVELLPTAEERSVLAHLGPDPLRDDWDPAIAATRLRSDPGRAFVAALLDQRNLAGLGNLWVNELAFLTGINPFAPVGAVDVDALVERAARSLRLSATVPGMYQVTTGDTRRGRSHWVAGRAGRPCLRCGTTVLVRAEAVADPQQRRTWWCPNCQPMRSNT
ncbi:Fpg/Nei family DNA glycosylase [Amnibacterium flavum]|uniref:DNA-(apurinic or apyrimidinic site) lyase n=1 Tax=Amnibacterium flavum TaxID=2173173 RepID=A0A2V1HRZ8_9MICO|nr:DNA-formamidopyrimidine glycosylase family protein [Amnibacterium flavum]PVZ95328.1 endonuclease VIII [Amnibacterium flavum]